MLKSFLSREDCAELSFRTDVKKKSTKQCFALFASAYEYSVIMSVSPAATKPFL